MIRTTVLCAVHMNALADMSGGQTAKDGSSCRSGLTSMSALVLVKFVVAMGVIGAGIALILAVGGALGIFLGVIAVFEGLDIAVDSVKG